MLKTTLYIFILFILVLKSYTSGIVTSNDSDPTTEIHNSSSGDTNPYHDSPSTTASTTPVVYYHEDIIETPTPDNMFLRTVFMDLAITFLLLFSLLIIWKCLVLTHTKTYRLYIFLPMLIYLFKCGCFIVVIVSDEHYYLANYLDQVAKAFNILFILLLANGIWAYEYTTIRYRTRMILPATIMFILQTFNTVFLIHNLVNHNNFPSMTWYRLTGIFYLLPIVFFYYFSFVSYTYDRYMRAFIIYISLVYSAWWLVFALSIFLVPKLQIFITSTFDVIIAFLVPILMTEFILE